MNRKYLDNCDIDMSCCYVWQLIFVFKGDKVEIDKGNKFERIIGIYTRLINGLLVNKTVEANRYHVNERSIQRDIDDIRCYFASNENQGGIINNVIYDRTRKGYYLESINERRLTNCEILAICKILLDSRAFTKKEIEKMLNSLLACCMPEENQKAVENLIRNEIYHYIEPQHKKVFIDKMWEIGQAIQKNKYIEIQYCREKAQKNVQRLLKPVAIMFSEYYFYLTAFIEDEVTKQNFEVLNDVYPTIYRIDRIQTLRVMEERFRIPYSDRFEEGEFRKKIQFMYGGRLQRVQFDYLGYSIEAVLDRLPTAKIVKELNGVYTITAEVFGKGIDMWIRSQGNDIRNVKYY